jgi:hypothetical protein
MGVTLLSKNPTIFCIHFVIEEISLFFFMSQFFFFPFVSTKPKAALLWQDVFLP